MSYPYPQDRTRDKRTKGEEPYEDAREALAENEAELRRAVPNAEQQRAPRTDEEQAHDAEERFETIGDDIAEERQEGDGS